MSGDGDELIEVQPCAEYGKCTLEARFGHAALTAARGFFDPIQMCAALQRTDAFTKVKCSPEIGYAIMERGEKRIHVFKGGKIIMRRADDREDAEATLALVGRTLWGAVVCPLCGTSGQNCQAGGCEPCSVELCPVLERGPPGERSACPSKKERCGLALFSKVQNLPTRHLFDRAIRGLDQYRENLRSLDEGIRAGDGRCKDDVLARLQAAYCEVLRCGSKFVAETPRSQDAWRGMVLSGIAEDLKAAEDGMLEIDPKTVCPAYSEALALVLDAFDSFRKGACAAYTGLQDRFAVWSEKHAGLPKPCERIATAALRISRILCKPVPG